MTTRKPDSISSEVNALTNTVSSVPELTVLLRLFYADSSTLGQCTRVTSALMPAPYRQLLAHHAHMTVTIEEFYNESVDVQVLDSQQVGNFYQRKILLRRQSDSAVVQFGIVRLDLRRLQSRVRDEILAQKAPLGRILIENNVLREVQLAELWRVQVGDELANYFQVGLDAITFGRTALIYCDGEPAVELLEIVSPVRSANGGSNGSKARNTSEDANCI